MARFTEAPRPASARNVGMGAAQRLRAEGRPAAAAAASAASAGQSTPRLSWLGPVSHASGGGGRLLPLSSFAAGGGLEAQRRSFESRELDRLFGGGLVPGSVTLIGGPPGACSASWPGRCMR